MEESNRKNNNNNNIDNGDIIDPFLLESAVDASLEGVDNSGISVFGFDLVSSGGKKKNNNNNKKDQKRSKPETFVDPSYDDGSAVLISTGEHHLAYHDLGNYYGQSDVARIMKYREIANYPEVDQAIEEIVNELIVIDDEYKSVEISLDNAEGLSDKIKKTIEDEFDSILRLLSFSTNAYDIAKKWYVDGRLVYHIILDETKKEILELRPIDPVNIKKVKEIEEIIDPKTRVKTYKTKSEYFVYTDNTSSTGNSASSSMISSNGAMASTSIVTGKSMTDGNQGLKISKDAIVFVPSGILDESRKNTISYLHKVIKTANQLRMLEDSLVIYRLVRAPERRVFRVDVGGLPAKKAEGYIQNIIAKYRNKISYDANTGELADARQNMAMIEDFWFPTREGRGTDIDTLSGGCLAMDTKVSLLDGRELSIKDIESEMKDGKQLWTYSCHPETGEIAPGLISWAGVTQDSAKVMRITLDNGESITCTPDHKFPIYDHGFKRADELCVDGDNLISLSRENHKKVTKIEWLDEPIQVGTLTIDQDEIIHDYHTFALSAGIFTKNSTLGEIDDVVYFQKKLFRALNVPLNRMEQESQFSLGRTSEISRDEVKFSKFISKLRSKFSDLFYQLLRVQLLLKNIITESEWEEIRQSVFVNFLKDNHFSELKESEIIRERLGTLREIDDYVGKYFSKEWIQRNVLRQTDQDIDDIKKQIEKEEKSGELDSADDEQPFMR